MSESVRKEVSAALEPLGEQAAAVRDRRRAEQAERLAANTAQRAQLEAEALAIAAARRQLDEARAARQALRAQLETEAARLVAERERLDSLESAARDREHAQVVAQEGLAAQQARMAAEAAELAAAMQRELDEIDRKVEARARTVSRPRVAVAPSANPAAIGRIGSTRRKSRLHLSASVLIDEDGKAVALPVVNVSLTGALLDTSADIPPSLVVGATQLITLFATEKVELQVDVTAKVVRRDEQGTAIDWSEDQAASAGVARFFASLM